MRIAVCMKQVPATSEGDMDKETGMLKRAGLEAIVNTYDLAALEAALRLKEQTGAQIHVFTMGPEKAEVLPGVFLRQPGEGMLLVETGERKMLKSQISYAIIVQSPLLGEADLVIDCYGGIYTGRNGPRLHRMPTGDCNLLLGG